MAARASYGVAQHTLSSMEFLARQAVITANGSIWASTSKAIRTPVSQMLRSTYRPSASTVIRRSGTACEASSTPVPRESDASQLHRMLFKQDTRPASQPKLPRRIARLYSRRPLLFRQLESLRSPTSSSLSTSRPFFSSSFRRGYSSNANAEGGSSSSSTGGAGEKSGLMGKLKELTRKYGWATVVVYMLFSVVDFGACFFVINLVGAEHVRKGQDYVLDALVYGTTKTGDIVAQNADKNGHGLLGFLKSWREKHKIEDAENSASSGTTSLWATAVLAYGIHKTLLLPVRLGLTAAATPAIVK